MKSILFLSGTRADFGKLKPLIQVVSRDFDYCVFTTGMHMLARYGLTINEIENSGFNTYPFINLDNDTPADEVLANTVHGLSLYVRERRPDLLVIHGDRVEALAGAIVGNFNGILTAHIEGGELSGTLDGMVRHSITKLSHVHLCANFETAKRLWSMGEHPSNVYAIGSPDVDAMLSPDLPSLDKVKAHYHIPFHHYGILIYHPVKGEDPTHVFETILAAKMCGKNWIVIYPNNDEGSSVIIKQIESMKEGAIILPSMRFEYFLALLKHADVILGNSSAGIREAPVYGVPTVNVGTRQADRAKLPSIVNVRDDYNEIVHALVNLPEAKPSLHFGRGDSARQFLSILKTSDFWETPLQKRFWEGE